MSSEVQIAVIDQQDTQIVLAVPGVQGATGSEIAAGGTANQVLRKASSTDYDTDWSLVTNAMVDSSAAIAGTKISPNFGSQNVVTTGTSTAASFIPTSSSVPANGVYLPSANNVAISTNGTGKLFIDANGNVGLGTGSPANYANFVTLALADTSGAEIDFIKGSTIQGTFYNAGDIFYIESKSTVPTAFVTNGTERARIDSSGRLLVGTSSQSGGSLLQVNDNRIRIASSKTPASASDTGTAGEICWDSSYIYVCTATNTWKRAALSTW